MSSENTLEVTFVAADRNVWSGQAQQVVAPAIDGALGMIPGMIPTLSVLQEGDVRIKGIDGAERRMHVTGGFVSIDRDVVTLVVDEASAR